MTGNTSRVAFISRFISNNKIDYPIRNFRLDFVSLHECEKAKDYGTAATEEVPDRHTDF